MRVLPLVLLACLLASPTLGGSVDDPDITDPAGDHAGFNPSNSGCNPNAGPNVYDADDFQDIDLLKVWFAETLDSDTVTIGLTTSAAVDEGDYFVDFSVAAGPNTMPGSSATPEGETFRVRHNNGAYSGVEGGTSAASGSQVVFTFPKASLGVAGGEVVSGFTATGQRTTMEIIPQLCADNWGFRDTAGPADALQFSRPPATPGLNLTGHSVHVLGLPGDLANVTLADGNGTVEYAINITNEGDAQDTINITVANLDAQAALGVDINVTLESIVLAPGETAMFNVTVRATGVGPGQHGAIIVATSSLDPAVQALFTAFFTVPGEVAGDDTTTPGDDPTAGEDDDTVEKDTPGLHALALLALLGAVAALRRRR